MQESAARVTSSSVRCGPSVPWAQRLFAGARNETLSGESALIFAAVVRCPPARAVNELAGHRSFRYPAFADVGIALHFRRGHAGNDTPSLHFDFQPQLISRTDGPPELGSLNAGKHHHLVMTVFHFRQQQRTSGL